MPDVDWTLQALQDLQELPPQVAHAILEVGRASLHTPDQLLEVDPNEGHIGTTRNGLALYWRRGITREKGIEIIDVEKELSAKNPSGADEEDDIAQPWNYILFYRPRTLKEIIRHKSRGLVVLRVLHISRFGPWVQDMF